jgi:hypothetical protein
VEGQDGGSMEGCSQRGGKRIWGKTRIKALWWTIRRESGCSGFVMRKQSKGGAQFIEVGHGYSEFGKRVEHDGDKIMHWRPHRGQPVQRL